MADKDKKDKMVDFPQYDPDRRVPFPPPPGSESPFGQARPKKDAPAPEAKRPYYEDYDPDPPSPDPSQTTPGAPDIRDIGTQVPDGELPGLSPE